ncbi:PREDICTED: caspase-3-like [Branchiostoma belcheri]|uniref:Caspase-3-like n=1 Tax=Branchiostoma belcheri TaxID=7741 RepID=A0A6P4YMA5_BRABE|nr:PREDICTED: caspase-3-like [Branchiostoma belcheri]XP_019625533.1 PREDICTED: caspase-3-like [Branchiostoma belcheri]
MFRLVFRIAAKPASADGSVCTRLTRQLNTGSRQGQAHGVCTGQCRSKSQTTSKLAALAGFAGVGIIAGEVWISNKRKGDNALAAKYLKELKESHSASSQVPSEDKEAITNEEKALRYDMSHPRRGLAVIINNKHFNASTQMEMREGSEVDLENLSQVLLDLDFEVRVYTDLTCKQMRRVLRQVADEDHGDSDCLLVSIMSHGYKGEQVYGVDGLVNVDKLSAYFRGENCKTLIGKPKLFVIQACQGERLMEGVTLASTSSDSDVTLRPQSQTLPSGADFLYFYSVSQGYYSWRNIRQGSWLIQALCKVLREDGYSGLEIMQLLTKVNRQVATEFESLSPDESFNKKKQIPCIVSMLTKELYFTQKLPTLVTTESI